MSYNALVGLSKPQRLIRHYKRKSWKVSFFNLKAQSDPGRSCRYPSVSSAGLRGYSKDNTHVVCMCYTCYVQYTCDTKVLHMLRAAVLWTTSVSESMYTGSMIMGPLCIAVGTEHRKYKNLSHHLSTLHDIYVKTLHVKALP